MADLALFPPAPLDRLAILAAFIEEERRQRQRMLARHPERGDYWLERIKQAERAMAHVEALAEEARS